MTTTTLTPADRIAAATDRIMELPTLVAYGMLAGLLTVLETSACLGQITAEQVATDIEAGLARAENRVGRVAK